MIECPKKCKEKLKMEELGKHFVTCEEREIYFTCDICDERIDEVNERNQHSASCPEARLKCPYCNIDFKNKDVKEHMIICNMRLIKCGKCLCLVPFKYETSHTDFFCKSMSEIRRRLFQIQRMFVDYSLTNY